jgi:hypothetical protein
MDPSDGLDDVERRKFLTLPERRNQSCQKNKMPLIFSLDKHDVPYIWAYTVYVILRGVIGHERNAAQLKSSTESKESTDVEQSTHPVDVVSENVGVHHGDCF